MNPSCYFTRIVEYLGLTKNFMVTETIASSLVVVINVVWGCRWYMGT